MNDNERRIALARIEIIKGFAMANSSFENLESLCEQGHISKEDMLEQVHELFRYHGYALPLQELN